MNEKKEHYNTTSQHVNPNHAIECDPVVIIRERLLKAPEHYLRFQIEVGRVKDGSVFLTFQGQTYEMNPGETLTIQQPVYFSSI